MINIHYLKRYLKFCNYYKTSTSTYKYTEKHHIIPKSLGGNNSKLNIVEMPCKAHLLAHEMLFKAFPSRATSLAYRMMCDMHTSNTTNRVKPSLRQLTKAREAMVEHNSGKNHPMYGKKASKATREKQRKAKLGKPGNRKGKKLSKSSKNKVRNSLLELYSDPYCHPRTDKTIYHFIHDGGITYFGTIIGMTKFLFKDQKLDSGKLREVLNGDRKSHKGWRKLHVNTEVV